MLREMELPSRLDALDVTFDASLRSKKHAMRYG